MKELKGKPMLVTIDGPAASGKTSVSRGVAGQLGWSWVSTGAFYRGVAFVATQEKVPLDDEAALIDMIQNTDWSVNMTPEHTLVFYKGEDVTGKLHTEEVGAAASQISQHQGVRAALLQAQRNCAKESEGLVAEGRDCGTVVFPQAPVKIYLTANLEDRARRRAEEEGSDLEKTIEKQTKRDAQDSGRPIAPMQVPENAHVIDTSNLNLDQVVAKVLGLVEREFH